MVHRASGTGVWRHRRSRLLASKLGTRCIALHVRCKSSLLRHGRLTVSGMGARVRNVPWGLRGHLCTWPTGR